MVLIIKKVAIVVILFFAITNIFACTEIDFVDNGKIIGARNMDWFSKAGFIVINPRNLKRDFNNNNLLSWVSKYGSVTFDVPPQKGRPYLGQDGMNEMGLSAASLCFQKTKYSKKHSRPVVLSGYWNQYILDNFKSVKEVLAAMPKIRIAASTYRNKKVNTHEIISDATGDVAVLEYVNGKLKASHQKTLPFPVLTNDSYEKSLKNFLKNTKAIGFDSQSRFMKAVEILKITKYPVKINTAFAALKAVSEPASKTKTPTVWYIVRDNKNKKLWFKEIGDHKIKSMNINKINFSKKKPTRMLCSL